MQCEKRITYRGHWGSREVATTFLDLGPQLTQVHAPYDLTNFLDPMCSPNLILTDDLERTMVGEGQLRRPQAPYASRKLTSETAPTVVMRPFRAVLDALVNATGRKLWLPSTIPHAFSLSFYPRLRQLSRSKCVCINNQRKIDQGLANSLRQCSKHASAYEYPELISKNTRSAVLVDVFPALADVIMT